MKTTSFSTIDVSQTVGTDVLLSAKVPGSPAVEIEMTADELLIFIVELSNGLTDCRRKELLDLQSRELLKERLRAKS